MGTPPIVNLWIRDTFTCFLLQPQRVTKGSKNKRKKQTKKPKAAAGAAAAADQNQRGENNSKSKTKKEINPNRPTWIFLRSRDAQDKINYIHGRHGSRATESNRDRNGTNKPNVTCPNLNGGAGTRQLRERLHVHVMHACFN